MQSCLRIDSYILYDPSLNIKIITRRSFISIRLKGTSTIQYDLYKAWTVGTKSTAVVTNTSLVLFKFSDMVNQALFLDVFLQQSPTQSWRKLEFFEKFLEFFAKFLEFFVKYLEFFWDFLEFIKKWKVIFKIPWI